MRVLNNRMIVPPGGWKYTVSETGAEISAPCFDDLVSAVSKHLSSNQISIACPDGVKLRDVIENGICESIPEELSRVVGTSKHVSFSRAAAKPSAYCLPLNFGRTVLDRTINLIIDIQRKHGAIPTVSSSLAETRAERAIYDTLVTRSPVCYSCKHMGPVDSAMGRKLRTSLDSHLHVCGVFGVYLRPLVHIELSALLGYLKNINVKELNDTFWLKPELTGGQ